MDSPFRHVDENEAYSVASGYDSQASRSHDGVPSYGAPSEVTTDTLHDRYGRFFLPYAWCICFY